MDRGKLIGIEGISGVGKTYFKTILEKHYANNSNIVFQNEITDEMHQGIQKQIFDILSSGSNLFDFGMPMTETVLLVAIATHKEEMVIQPSLANGKLIVSDRSIDSICIYQALTIAKKYGGCSLELANRIFDILSQFCTVPVKTFLLKDDLEKCIERAETRNCIQYSRDDIVLLTAASILYGQYVELHKERFEIIDLLGLNTQEIKKQLINGINDIFFKGSENNKDHDGESLG